MMTKVLLDANILLGMTRGYEKEYIRLTDYFDSDSSQHVIYLCPEIIDEVTRNLIRDQFGVHIFYRHIIGRYTKRDRLVLREEGELSSADCEINDPDDVHLIRCANGNNVELIISNDGKLEISNCEVSKIMLRDFLTRIMVQN